MKYFLFLLLFALPLRAHEGPEHHIEELTDRLSTEGESADLLLQRSIEYLVIRSNTAAVKDLERALQLAPKWPAIQRELGRAYFATGKTNEALQVVSRGLEDPVAGADRAALLMVRSEILQARGENSKALDDANDAIREHPRNVEWYLFRGQLQHALKRTRERVAGLEQGIEATGSGLLQIEWIDALIDDRQFSRALEKVEAELNASRLQASWLIRRAKIYLATDKKEAATADLEAALRELNGRMTSAAPDPSLLIDRGTVHDLLGDSENARKDFTSARDKDVTDPWMLDRIRELRP